MTIAVNLFHDHLDECAQCREQPMNLCPMGAALLGIVVGVLPRAVACNRSHRRERVESAVSAPEFDGTPMTRREVLLARYGFTEALRGRIGQVDAPHAAALVFPLPTVTRPRVVAVEDQPGLSLRIVDGVMQCLFRTFDWAPVGVLRITPGLRAALRSLDAEPTETVTEEEG